MGLGRRPTEMYGNPRLPRRPPRIWGWVFDAAASRRLDAFRTRSETPRRQTAVAEKIPRGHPIPDEDGGHPVPIEHPQPDLHTLAETDHSAPSPAPQRCQIRRPGGILAMRSGLVPTTA